MMKSGEKFRFLYKCLVILTNWEGSVNICLPFCSMTDTFGRAITVYMHINITRKILRIIIIPIIQLHE